MESLDRYVRMGWHEYRKKEDKTMSEHVKAYVEQKVKEMMAAHSCSVEAKAVGQKWLDALGTEHEAEETKHLLAELEHDIVTVDGLIAFAASETGAQVWQRKGSAGRGTCKRIKEIRCKVLRLPGVCGSICNSGKKG